MEFADVIEATDYLLQKVLVNPFDIFEFNSIWQICEAKGFPMLSLWKIKSHFLFLSQKDILQWEDAISREVSDPSSQRQELDSMVSILCQKYPTPHNFLRRFDTKPPENNVILEAYIVCGSDYLFGQLIWEKVTSLSSYKDNAEALTELYLKRLLIPHRQLQQTFESFSSWVTFTNPESYTSLMREASSIVKTTEKRIRYYEQFETIISENCNVSTVWVDYMNSISKNTNDRSSFMQITQTFLRSLKTEISQSGSREWIPVWSTFLKISESIEHSNSHSWAMEFIKSYPNECEPYNMIVRGLSVSLEIDVILDLIRNSHCIIPANYADWKDLVMNIITMEFNAYVLDQNRTDVLLQTLEELVLPATQFSDEYHEVVKLCISVLESIPDGRAMKLATMIISELFENFALQASAWIYALNFFQRAGRKKHVDKLLTLWIDDSLEMDKLDFFLSEIVMFYRLHCDYAIYLKAFDQAVEIKNNFKQRLPEDVQVSQEPEKKRQKTHLSEQKDPVRSREQFRIKIANIPSWATVTELSTFFEGYGSPVSVQFGENGGTYAIVEFSSESEVLASLARDKKTLGGKEVSVSRIFANTVWVTNYPSSFDPLRVTKLIEQTGEKPLDIRFPVQNDNKQRRFCYVDYGSTEEAQSARNYLHEKNLEGFIIQAEISNPSLKRARHTQPINRQVYVRNLNFKKTNESSLWKFFSKFGDLETIRMPLNEKNKALGNQNSGFAFVTFTTEIGAREAISLGGAEIDGRRVDISMVKTKENLRKSTRFERDLTVSIHNVNEIVTEDCLKIHAENQVGPVAKCQLVPSKKGALIQFTLIAHAGRASIVLEGTEFEGRIIRVGQMLDFTRGDKDDQFELKVHEKVEQRSERDEGTEPKTKMIPPALLRRRRR